MNVCEFSGLMDHQKSLRTELNNYKVKLDTFLVFINLLYKYFSKFSLLFIVLSNGYASIH